MPNNIEKTNKEETQLIFRIRSQVINLKMNMKSQYDTFECSICHKEEESQIHVYECKEILKMKKCDKERPKYEEIMTGDVHKKIQVARIFKENFKIFEQNKANT